MNFETRLYWWLASVQYWIGYKLSNVGVYLMGCGVKRKKGINDFNESKLK